MADETHGIEIEIDSRPAESGKERVVRSLDEIKKKTEELGKAGAAAGKQTSDGLASSATGGAKAGRTMDEIRAKAKSAGAEGARAGETMTDAWRRVATGIDRTVASASRLQPSFAQLEASANRVGRADPFKGFETSANRVMPSLLNLKNLLLSFGAVGLAKYVVNTEATFRGFDQALKIVTGSQSEASKEMDFARDTAEKLGLRIKDLTGSYVGLLAAARGTNLEGEKSQQVFAAISKAGVAYGLSNDQIKGALLAVQQMMSKGTVQAEELRGQLGERLPGAFQVAARAMGVTTQQLGKLLEAGSVVSSDFLPKFAAQLNKEIPDGAKSAYAGFNSFLDQLDRATRVLANSGLFEGLASGAKSLGDTLQGLANDGSLAAIGSAIGKTIQFLGQNIELLKAGAIAYGVYFAAIKAGVIYAFIAELVALEVALGATTTASALFSVGMKGLQAVLGFMVSPLALVAAGVTGLILAFSAINQSGSATQALLAGVGKQALNASSSLETATDRALKGAFSINSVGAESNGAVAGVDNFAGAVGRAAAQLYELAKARQVAALSSLVKQRNEAATTFNQLRAQSDVGLAERAENARQTAGSGSGLRRIGSVVRGVGQAFGVARDTVAKATGLGPDETAIRQGAATAKASVDMYDEAITRTKSSLEQFVTIQDKAAASAANTAKPNKAMATALAQQAGATTAADKAAAGLAVTRAQADADLKAGTITQAEWTDRVGGAIRAVHDLRDATQAHSKSLAEQKKAQAEANRVIAEGTRNAGSRQRISDRYDQQPRYLDQLDTDNKKLDDMVGQWIDVGDAVVKYTQAMRDADQAQLDLAKNRPFNDIIQGMDNELAIQAKILQGRTIEAEALQQKIQYERQYGAMLPAQYADLLKHVAAQESISRALEDQRRIAGLYVQTVNEIQGAFETFLNDAMKNPFKATLDFGKNIAKSLKQLSIREISESVFGGLDREIEDMVSGKAGVQAANKLLVDTTTETTTATGTLAEAMIDAADLISQAAQKSASAITGVPISAGSPVDASGDIVVTGTRPKAANDNTKVSLRDQMIQKVVGRVGGGLEKLWNSMPKGMQNVLSKVGGTIEGGLKKIGITLPKGTAAISGAISKGLKGAGEGMFASSIVGKLGLKQSKTGAAIGGAAGSFLPIPGGGFIGGIVGGTIGGLFKKTKQASAGVTIENGQAVGGTGKGTGKAEKAQAGALAGGVADGLNSIAQTLGGQLSGSTGVSIGYRPGHKAGAYRVDPTGQGRLTGVDAYETEAEAIAAAIKIAVKNGVITGISDASKRVLQSSSNTDTAVAAASVYEDLLRQAAKLKDPIKGAFDEVKKGMDTTINQLKAAGYSAADIAAVQSVFNAQQKQVLENMTAGYKSFLDDITKGPDSGMTIYDQFTQAQKDFATTKAGLADGSTTQDEFTAAGQKLFDLARQTYGTATPEFEAVKADLVSATQDALKAVEAAASDNGVIAAVQAAADQASTQRDQTNEYLAQIAASLGTNNDNGYSDTGQTYNGTSKVQKQAY